MKKNPIPKGLVPLEELFYRNDVAKNPNFSQDDSQVEDGNIGTKEYPKIIKLSKALDAINIVKYI